MLLPFTQSPFRALARTLKRLSQHIARAEEKRYRMMHKLELTSRTARKARTRSLIAIGGLASKAGLLDTFGIILGDNLQKSPQMKEPAAALFKGFLLLIEMANSGEINQQLCSAQGLEALRKLKEQNSLRA